jgi:hypothetical protein
MRGCGWCLVEGVVGPVHERVLTEHRHLVSRSYVRVVRGFDGFLR